MDLDIEQQRAERELGTIARSATAATPAAERRAIASGRSRRGLRSPVISLAGLSFVLLAVVLASVCLGPVGIPFPETVRMTLRLVGIHVGHVSEGDLLVVRDIRLPRILLSVIAGAGLGVAGAVMQAFFRNPLADPGVTGVSSGAAVGAVVVLASGASVLGSWTLPAAAFVGALLVMALIQVIAALARDRTPVTLLLIGVALNAFFAAVVGAVISNTPDSQTARGAMFWLQGDLNAASWADVRLVIGPAVVCVLLVGTMTRELNAFLLGDDQAQSIGVAVGRVRAALLVLTAVLVGSIVSVTGVIGFVGLVVPHAVRLVIGADHRWLLPASALLGASFLAAADTVARVVVEPGSWQTGVVCALAGSPVFLLLVLRARRVGRAA